MKPVKPNYETLILVCATERPEGSEKPSCGFHGAMELRAWLKRQLKDRKLWPRIRVLNTSCLDICPKKGVILSFDNGRTLVRVDAEKDREAVLARILEQVGQA